MATAAAREHWARLRGFRGPVQGPPGYANRHRASPCGVTAPEVDRVRQCRWSPPWSPYRFPDRRLGLRGTGAQFEEILVVTGSRDPGKSTFRLDDDPPHTRRWAEGK